MVYVATLIYYAAKPLNVRAEINVNFLLYIHVTGISNAQKAWDIYYNREAILFIFDNLHTDANLPKRTDLLAMTPSALTNMGVVELGMGVKKHPSTEPIRPPEYME